MGVKLNHLSLIATLLVLLPGLSLARDPDVTASVASENVFLGESIRVTVKVSNYKSGMEPDLSRIQNCTIEFVSQGDQSFHNISVINGHRKVTGFSGRVFEYNLTPTLPGKIRLGPITVTSKNNATTIPGPMVIVHGVEPQDRVIVDLNVSKTEVIVEESFSVEMRVQVQALPSPYDDASPLPVENSPHLTIPYLKQDAFDDLEGQDINKFLNAMLINNNRSPGFAINNVNLQSSGFGGFFNFGGLDNRPTAARFDLKSTRVMHQGKSYFMYSLKLEYVPTGEGTHTFGPVAFKGEVFKGVSSSGRGITESIFASAEQQTVHVVPPPELGRPASYVGAIGTSLSAKSSLDTQTCFVGDPLTLEIAISGDIRKENLLAPRLGLQENLGKDFRIYEDSIHSMTRDDARVYQYTVRPTRPGTLEFPPVAVSFYNTQTRTYDTVLTDPIPVRAKPATEVEGSIIIDTAEQNVTIMTENSDPNLTIPAPFEVGASLAHTETLFAPRLHIPFLLLGPLLFLGATLIRTIRKQLPTAAKRRQQTSAASQARQRLSKVPTIAASSSIEARQELAAILRTYVEMRFGLVATAMTPADLTLIFSQRKISPPLTETFIKLMERSFNAGFQTGAQSDTEIDDDTDAARHIIELLEGELGAPRVKRAHKTLRIVKRWLSSLVLTLLTTAMTLAESKTTPFDSQLAMSQISTANTPAQFDRLALTLKRMLDKEYCNAPLLYNYGTALLMADHPQAALNAFLRAERYSGTTWELKRNMILAIHKLDANVSDPKLPWYRPLLFWHYGLSGNVRITIASLAFLLLWIALLLRPLGINELSRTLLGVAVTLLIVFGSSAATTLYQELRPTQITTPILTTKDTVDQNPTSI